MDTKTSVSLHQRIVSEVQESIVSGRWPPGFHIPSEIELADEYGCARMTVNKALTHLTRVGLIERRRKAGSFVRSASTRSAVLEIRDIRTEVEEQGLAYSYAIIGRDKRRATKLDSQRLAMSKPRSIQELTCLHFAAEAPFCLEERIINLAVAPEVVDETFAELPPGSWLSRRVPWTSAEHRIKAASADALTASRLNVPEGSACLVIERRTWKGEDAVTQVRLTYPGARHELTAHFSPTSK